MDKIEVQSETITQQCRTCVQVGKKPILHCNPSVMRKTVRIQNDGTVINLNSDGSIPLSAQKNQMPMTSMVGVNHEPIPPTVGMVDTCGQTIQPKCQSCARFRATTVTISQGTNPTTGRMKFADVKVGGWCSIGEDGILKGTERVFCDPVLKIAAPVNELRGSCQTCKYNTSVFNLGMLDHSSPINYDLNPWQMDQARKSDSESIPIVISEMRRHIGQVPFPINAHNKKWTAAWSGLSRFYAANLVSGGIEMGMRFDPKSKTMVEYEKAYTVLIPGLGDQLRLETDNGDDCFGLITRVGNVVVVQVAAPWYRLLGFGDRDRIARPILPHVRCENCAGTAKIERFNGEVVACEHCSGPEPKPVPKTKSNEKYHGQRADYPRSSKEYKPKRLIDDPRIDPKCQNGCNPTWGPCYYHAKAPKVQESIAWVMAAPNPDIDAPNAGQLRVIRETVFTQPNAHDSIPETNPQRTLKLQRNGGHIKITDLNGNDPHIAVLFQQINNLWHNHARNKTERSEVLKFYITMMSRLEVGRGRRINFSWTTPNVQDPWHPYCALNDTDKNHPIWEYFTNSAGEQKLRVTSGHAEGEPEATTTVMVGGVPQVSTRGKLVRGLDFAKEWNDQFGTPRSDMSTSIAIASPMGYVEVLDVQKGCGCARVTDPTATKDARYNEKIIQGGQANDRIRQGLMRDPMFAWGKEQERREWERITNPGERLQEEMLINETLLEAGREKYFHPTEVSTPTEWRVIKLGIGLPAPVGFQFETTDELIQYLDSPTFIEGSDQTNSVGFWATMRARILGYDIGIHRAKQNNDQDIPSVMRFLESPHSDDNTALQETAERYICDSCFDQEQRSYTISEIENKNFACPLGCGGHLILRTKAREYMEAIMRANGDQIRKLAPTYRRSANEEIAGIADSRSWLQNQRLLSMGCKNYVSNSKWKPKSST